MFHETSNATSFHTIVPPQTGELPKEGKFKPFYEDDVVSVSASSLELSANVASGLLHYSEEHLKKLWEHHPHWSDAAIATWEKWKKLLKSPIRLALHAVATLIDVVFLGTGESKGWFVMWNGPLMCFKFCRWDNIRDSRTI